MNMEIITWNVQWHIHNSYTSGNWIHDIRAYPEHFKRPNHKQIGGSVEVLNVFFSNNRVSTYVGINKFLK